MGLFERISLAFALGFLSILIGIAVLMLVIITLVEPLVALVTLGFAGLCVLIGWYFTRGL